MCRVLDNISHLMSKSIENWQTIPMSGNEEILNIQRVIQIFREESFKETLYLPYCL